MYYKVTLTADDGAKAICLAVLMGAGLTQVEARDAWKDRGQRPVYVSSSRMRAEHLADSLNYHFAESASVQP